MDIAKLCETIETYLVEQRRYFHQYPELSGEEKETTKEIVRQLEGMGIPCETLPSGCGAVGTIEGIYPGRTIGIRADIDALPIQEETQVDYKSKIPGKMHACGHDAHIAMLIGVAKVLNEKKAELHGTVKLLFQSAEEVGGGTREIFAYLDKTGGLDEVIGTHIWASLPEGEVLLIPGAVFAGTHTFAIEVKGKGGHGARPDQTNDPIKAACDLLMQITAIPSNYHSVLDRCVVSVCSLQAGDRGNVIPDNAVMKGTVRYFKHEDYLNIVKTMEKKMRGVEIAHDVQIEFKGRGGNHAPVYNTPESIERAIPLVDGIDGLKVSPQTDPICASDNFAQYLERYPGFYAILGAGNPEKGCEMPQHNVKFNIDEAALRKGCQLLASYAWNYLQEGEKDEHKH